ncbi:hypothetical protein [Dyadobacter sp. 3J3]|uniref:hypothetical protein n=1 Tax=Dyadobacter sp. 3J3 TaxID=2606600 RepID=UPI0013598A29|nr:hypothetical protein [Dyadobacter sp. 3J3]
MAKLLILVTFICAAAITQKLIPALIWICSNPTMYTESFGYLPLLIITVMVLLAPKIAKQIKQ